MKRLPGFKIDFESTDKVLPLHQYFSIIKQRPFEFCTEERFASYILSNEGKVKASILLILLKCIVVGYPNGNESFIGRLLSNYGPLNMLFHFFRDLICCVFHEAFVKKFMKKSSLFNSSFKNPFQYVVYYRKL